MFLEAISCNYSKWLGTVNRDKWWVGGGDNVCRTEQGWEVDTWER